LAADTSVGIVDAADPAFWGFNPAQVTVNVGDTVTWANTGRVLHTVTANNGAFNSGAMAPGGSWSFDFTTPGLYSYFCGIHPWMHGSVSVGGSAPPPPSSGQPPQPATAPQPSFSGDPAITLTIDQPAVNDQIDTAQVLVKGWSVDTSAPEATGVDEVRIYLDGDMNNGYLLGQANYGVQRQDVAAGLGQAYLYSGYEFNWTDVSDIPPGVHTLTAASHSTVHGWAQRTIPLDLVGKLELNAWAYYAGTFYPGTPYYGVVVNPLGGYTPLQPSPYYANQP